MTFKISKSSFIKSKERQEKIVEILPVWVSDEFFKNVQNHTLSYPVSTSNSSSDTSSCFSSFQDFESETNSLIATVTCDDSPWFLEVMGRTIEIEDLILIDDKKYRNTKRFDEESYGYSYFGNSTIFSNDEICSTSASTFIKEQQMKRKQLKVKSRNFLHKKSILKRDENSLLADPCQHIHFLSGKIKTSKKLACPYCRRYLHNRQALLTNKIPNYSSSIEEEKQLVEFEKLSIIQEYINNPRDDSSILKGEVTDVLIEGWIMKYGNDWFGNNGWKPRFARLVFMRVHNFHIEIPVLHTYWYEFSRIPSSSFILASSNSEVCLNETINKSSKRGLSYSFDVLVCDKKMAKRTFAAPEDQVEEWIYAITLALASYKRLQRKRVAPSSTRSPTSVFKELNWEPGNFLFKETFS